MSQRKHKTETCNCECKEKKNKEEVKERVLILGAAGRDFHNFNTVFRKNPYAEVVGFTAQQIPGIDDRMYPAVLAGPLYPKGIKIYPEADLEKLIDELKVTNCILSYSDLRYNTVMTLACRCLAKGANFQMLGYKQTFIKSTKPVIAITAIRTGCGKSQTTRYVADIIKKAGKTPVVIRHPMPYGDLAVQAVQRFASYDDLIKHKVTIEEREEYEQHIDCGTIVYAGVDYEGIIRAAEKEADVVLWDGGNNDYPFYTPDLWIVVADPHRPGHELSYYPGDCNFRAADIIVINKANTAEAKNVEMIKTNAKKVNPKAKVFVCDSEVTVDDPKVIKGKKIICVDDGPTLTHGEMTYGAGKVAADKYEAKEIIDPRPFFLGTIKSTYEKYSHIGKLVPAMGYFPQQIKDLEDTIAAIKCEGVIIATPMDLRKLIKIKQPSCVAKYALVDRKGPVLSDEISALLKKL
eukprot:TRINITY_DN8_c1_g1_i1.p1 TRINITY_DN8_c1_g1~~TRINITY_DN8_c1_g1_i1.p1  ORF type:complete len:463 (+),score=129.40 TRINITY_DN8_c1_g1_i1:82-1470(+)